MREATMDGDRWAGLRGGYRMEFDPRPALAQLRSGHHEDAAWDELWNELHHQGDVGEASYAAVPELVRIYKDRRVVHWRTYALVGRIELQRTEGDNPKLPAWLEEEYFSAIQELAAVGARDVLQTSDPDTVMMILGIIAVSRGLRVTGRLLLSYSETEIEGLLAGM
jgi:hypothetical protein